jgi:hypothetical protein
VGIGDGKTCPLFDGTNDYTNIYSTAFRDAFDGAEGTLLIWAKVSSVDVWTDAASRFPAFLRVDASNQLWFNKPVGADRMTWYFESGGTFLSVTKTSINPVGWMCLAMTWSESADEMKAYYNGVQTGSTQTGLGTWAGALSTTRTLVGANTIVPTGAWDGYLAHVAVFGSALSDAAIADLAVV